jgi:transposase
MEATGPAWRAIAIYFVRRGHLLYLRQLGQAHDLRRFLSRHAKSNSIDALTLAVLPIVGAQDLLPLELGSHKQAPRGGVKEFLVHYHQARPHQRSRTAVPGPRATHHCCPRPA